MKMLMKSFSVLLFLSLFALLLSCGGGGEGQAASDITGNWAGNWLSTEGFSGSLSADITQSDGLLGGTISMSGSQCFGGGILSGTIFGSSLTFGFVEFGTERINFNGTVSEDGNLLSGTYSVVSGNCSGDEGTWDMIRQESPS